MQNRNPCVQKTLRWYNADISSYYKETFVLFSDIRQNISMCYNDVNTILNSANKIVDTKRFSSNIEHFYSTITKALTAAAESNIPEIK